MSADGGDVRPQRSDETLPAKKAPAKKAPAKKTAAKKTAAKKGPAKKAPPKKTAERAPAKKTASSAGRNAPTVAVTGAAHGPGLAVARCLSASRAVGKVVAIDTVRGHVPGATWRLADVRDATLVDKLDGVEVLVHLALDIDAGSRPRERRELNVDGTAAVLTAAAAAGVSHVVVVTSAMVYGAEPDNPVPLPEDAPLRALADSGLLGDLLEIEDLAARAARAPGEHPNPTVTVVRPAALVGPGIDTVLTRHFESPALLAVKGARPAWQFCHTEDLATAIEAVITHRPAGPLTAVGAGCDGWLDHDALVDIAGKRRVELPAPVAFATAARLHRVGLTPTADSDLRYLVHPWAVENTWLRGVGWSPHYSNAQALRAQLEESAGRYAIGGHRLGRRDAAAGAAAGATVALLGTAALVRRARRRRRG